MLQQSVSKAEVDMDMPHTENLGKHYNQLSAAIEPTRQKKKRFPQKHLEKRHQELDECIWI